MLTNRTGATRCSNWSTITKEIMHGKQRQTTMHSNTFLMDFFSFEMCACQHFSVHLNIHSGYSFVTHFVHSSGDNFIYFKIIQLAQLWNGHSKSKSPKFHCSHGPNFCDKNFGWTFLAFQMFLLLIKDVKQTRNVVDVLFAFNIRISSKPATILSGASSSLA